MQPREQDINTQKEKCVHEDKIEQVRNYKLIIFRKTKIDSSKFDKALVYWRQNRRQSIVRSWHCNRKHQNFAKLIFLNLLLKYRNQKRYGHWEMIWTMKLKYGLTNTKEECLKKRVYQILNLSYLVLTNLLPIYLIERRDNKVI